MSLRTSIVGAVRVISVQLSSIVQAGDSVALAPRSQVLAVQREIPSYEGREGNLDQFRVFRQNIPEPLLDEAWSFQVRNECPDIRVGRIDIYGMSVSATLQIGSNKSVDTENRTKHIRQLLKGKRPV